MSIKFKNREHEKFYEQCLTQTGSLDPYHKAFFYTIGNSFEHGCLWRLRSRKRDSFRE